MPEKDPVLAQALKHARTAPMHFVFVAKGTKEGKLLVAKKSITAKEVADAKKEVGGGVVFRGRCVGDGGNLVFELPKAPPTTLKQQLKTFIHREAGLALPVDVRVAADLREEEEAPAPQPTPNTAMADFTARLKALMPAIQHVQGEAAAHEIKAWAGEAGALAAKHDFAGANALLNKVEAAVKAGPAGAGKSASTDLHHQVLNIKANIDLKIAALDKHPQHESIAYQIKDLKNKAELAVKLAQPPQPKEEEAVRALVAVSQACDDLKSSADISERQAAGIRDLDEYYNKKILDKKAEIDAMLDALEKHSQHARIAKEIQDAKNQLAQALKLAQPHPSQTHQEALKGIETAFSTCYNAKQKADMLEKMYLDLTSGSVGTAALKKLFTGDPDNVKLFDQLVETLDDRTAQGVLEVAMKVRFGVKVSQYEHKKAGEDADIKDVSDATAVDVTLPDKSLRRMYELLAKVPSSHVLGNPHLKEIVRFTKDEHGGMYSGGKVYLYCGRADNTQPYRLAKPSELPAVDGDCQPKDNTPPDYFDFATLHEVGHAVDDEKKFMDEHMSSPLYGGWEKTNPSKLAEIAKKQFGYDEDYIKSYLSGKKPDPPDPPKGTTPKAWQDARIKAEAWCDGIRVKKNLWWDGANSIALAIDGRVYQESYKGDWWSYSLDARKKGISGYQFRAPGEWFAELYAAYQSGKLKDSHPSMSWLKKL